MQMSEAEVWNDDSERESDSEIRREKSVAITESGAAWHTAHSSAHSAVQTWRFVQLQLIYVYTGKYKQARTA